MIRLAGISFVACIAFGFAVLHVFTKPAQLPEYAQARDNWRTSYAQLLDRHGESLGAIRADFSVRKMDWVKYQDLSPAVRKVFILAEDKRFFRHNGADWLALVNALRTNSSARSKRGASTISMQLASMLAQGRSPKKRRGIRQKIRQIRSARKLEQQWSKAEIFESWLNHISFSGELQGLDAASRILTGKPSSSLTLVDALQLAAIIPSPNARQNNLNQRACTLSAKLAEPVPCVKLQGFSRLGDRSTPDLAFHVKRELSSTASANLKTTLDKQVQIFAEDLLARKLDTLQNRNVRDGAILVVDNQSGEIRAWVGSNPQTSRARHVDGVLAKRQAGSTLKPHLYALAIERGLLHASSVIEDSPVALDSGQGLYTPQNYDHQYVGPVSVRHSLGNSLNIPAIKTLMMVGVDPFIQRLQLLGYENLIEDAEYYGFALALGSVEVSLLEQVRAYMAMANTGELTDLVLNPGAKPLAPVKVLPEETAYITAHMMADKQARIHTFGRGNLLEMPFQAAVKTGTSKAMRDNWCIGFSSRYTVGVWVGNFEGEPMTGVSGTTGAAPIWSELMTHLHAGNTPDDLLLPQNVETRMVRFQPAIEASRKEVFIAGTGRDLIEVTAAKDRIPRILQPVDGTIIALDPDIPPANQLVRFQVEGQAGVMQLHLNNQIVLADQLWKPVPGKYEIVLLDENGRSLDRARFTVR